MNIVINTEYLLLTANSHSLFFFPCERSVISELLHFIGQIIPARQQHTYTCTLLTHVHTSCGLALTVVSTLATVAMG